MPDESIIKHEKFIAQTKDYIKECLENKVNPAEILESFAKIIDEVVMDELMDKTKK